MKLSRIPLSRKAPTVGLVDGVDLDDHEKISLKKIELKAYIIL